MTKTIARNLSRLTRDELILLKEVTQRILENSLLPISIGKTNVVPPTL